MMIKSPVNSLWLALAGAAMLGGCASPVKLEQPVPVETRSTTTTTQSNGPATSAVQPIDQTGGQSIDDANMARVIYFDFDSYTVKPEFQQLIDAHARFLKANPQRRVSIEGHTDERGGREYNLALGERRANAVRDYLSSRGIAANRLDALSYGEERPKHDNAREETRRLNRRAAMVVRVQ